MWNIETVMHLHNWYMTPQGDFALKQEHKLFQNLVSIWPRRNHSVLDIGCGSGVFLEMLWDYGFDVTGIDTSIETIDIASERLGKRADFQIGQFDNLPFDTSSFNYAALLTTLEYSEDPRQIITEAFRVASDGIIIGFKNKLSINCLGHTLTTHKHTDTKARKGQWLNPYTIYRIIQSIYPACNISTRSTLLGPASTWKNSSFLKTINKITSFLPLGAYVGMRIDKHPQPILTPLLLKAKNQAMAVYTGLNPNPSGVQNNTSSREHNYP